MALYQYDDIVTVLPNNIDLKSCHGKKGIIRGIHDCDEDPTLFAYSVYFPKTKESCFIFEKELKATGMKADARFLETDQFIRVSVDAKTGKSKVIDD